MEVTFICPRGHRVPVDPDKLGTATRCPKCGKSIDLLPEEGLAGVTWLIVARRGQLPHMATPVAAGKKLRIGAAPNLWLHLEGDGIAPAHVEIRLIEAQKIHVRHLAAEGKTWIDRAVVLEGAVGPDNELRIGDYAMRVGSTNVVQRIANADAAPVVVDEGDDWSDAEDERPRAPRRASRFSDWSTGLKLRALGLVLLTAASLGFLSWTYFFPSVSAEMPADTAYTCPRDGTEFRGLWSEGPPKCPSCGALCFGSVRYDISSESVGVATSQPADMPAPAEREADAVDSSEPIPADEVPEP